MIRNLFTTQQLVPHSKTGGTVLRRDKYNIFKMEKLALWSSSAAEGKDIAGKNKRIGVGREGRGNRPSECIRTS